MNLLEIESSPRQDKSNSRALTAYLIDQLDPHEVVTRDLAMNQIPPISSQDLLDLHGGQTGDSPGFHKHLALSDKLIEELKWADTLVIGTPVHNFGVPAVLKQWIDHICRAGETFRYTANGPEGLTGIHTAYLVVASGGTPIGGDIDFVSPYLELICNFIGIKQVHVIDAGGSKRKPEEVIAKGKEQIDQMVKTIA